MLFHIVNYGAIVYRLGHLVFIQASGVRFPVALPSFKESRREACLLLNDL